MAGGAILYASYDYEHEVTIASARAVLGLRSLSSFYVVTSQTLFSLILWSFPRSE